MVTGGQMTVMALGSRAAVSALQPEPTARQPGSASPECELQTLAMEQGLLYTQLAGTQGLGASSAAEVQVLENINQLIHFPSYHNLKLHWSGHFIQTI